MVLIVLERGDETGRQIISRSLLDQSYDEQERRRDPHTMTSLRVVH